MKNVPCDTYVDGTEKKNNFRGILNIELHKRIIRYIVYNTSHHHIHLIKIIITINC